ncbi:uncharacterized protein [Diadema setosum]|uniref:uncharacterized protein n=1 Tax=Diadema setosum TaxID=31175 RepID=UPI003B3A0E70
MTRGPTMAETRWSLDAGTPADVHDAESTSTAPPISSYRTMYRHSLPAGSLSGGEGGGNVNSIPDQALATPMPSAMSGAHSTMSSVPETIGFSPSDWTSRDHHHYPIDLARIQLKPNARNSVPNMSKTISDSDIYGRSVNERLDKYMVIRQKTFHGLTRSKSELRKLPLTDPRETLSEGSTPTWLHRSKTDLYIEKWRSKAKRQDRHRSKSGSSQLDLDGITLGSLYESLPRGRRELTHSSPPRSSRKEVTFKPQSTPGALASNGSETRFPPLTTISPKNHAGEKSGNSVCKNERSSVPEEVGIAPLSLTSSPKDSPFTTPRKSPTSKILVLPSQDESYDEVPNRANNRDGVRYGGEALPRKAESSSEPLPTNNADDELQEPSCKAKRKGRFRKQPHAAIPLKLWEPSFDCVVVSSQKILQPRHLVRAWQRQGSLN